MPKKVTGKICEVLDEADFYLILTASGPLLMCSPDVKLEVSETMLFLNPVQLDDGHIFQTSPKFKAIKSKEQVQGSIAADAMIKMKKKLKSFMSKRSQKSNTEEKADTTQVLTFADLLADGKDKPQSMVKCVVGRIRKISPPIKTQYNYCKIVCLKDASGEGQLSFYDYHQRSKAFEEGDVLVLHNVRVTTVKKDDEAYRRLQTTQASRSEKPSPRVAALLAHVKLGDLAASGMILGIARASPYVTCHKCHKKMFLDEAGPLDNPQFSQDLLVKPVQCQECKNNGLPFLNFAVVFLVEHSEDVTIRLTAFRSHLMSLSLPTDVTITRDSLNSHLTNCLQGQNVTFDAEFVSDVGEEGETLAEFKSIVFKIAQ